MGPRVVTGMGVVLGGVVIHARPSEQFEGRRNEYQSTETQKQQGKARSVLLHQKNNAGLQLKD